MASYKHLSEKELELEYADRMRKASQLRSEASAIRAEINKRKRVVLSEDDANKELGRSRAFTTANIYFEDIE